jgi:hypothetical protein
VNFTFCPTVISGFAGMISKVFAAGAGLAGSWAVDTVAAIALSATKITSISKLRDVRIIISPDNFLVGSFTVGQ